MKVLIVGSGAREHALALLVSRSPLSPSVSVVSSRRNPGLARIAESTGGRLYRGRETSPQEVLEAAKSLSPDLVVIGPEEPLFAGVASALRREGFTVFGPDEELARVEKDKAYARGLMWRYRIPGRLRYKAFREASEALEYARAAGDVVVKPARQAGGSGVRVFAEPFEHLSSAAREAAAGYAQRLAEKIRSKYSDIDYTVLVEERVEGVEYTLMTVTDGETVIGLPLVQDNPHLYPFDLGPETGGMGAIAGPCRELPFITSTEYEESLRIVEETVRALREETGRRYIGALSGQMMLTGFWGPTLIEYYVRFGDPEVGALLPLVRSDFLELLDRAAVGRLSGYKLELSCDNYVVVKAAAPAGYPLDRARAKGHPVVVDEEAVRRAGCTLLYGGVDVVEGRVVSTGSRLVEVVCSSRKSFEEASEMAEKALAAVRLADGHPLIHRWDIGTSEYMQQRVEAAKRARTAYKRRRERGLMEIYDWIPGKGLVKYSYA